MNPRGTKFNLVFLFVSIVAIMMLQELFINQKLEIPYSEFLHSLDQDAIKEISIGDREIRGVRKTPEGKDQFFKTVMVNLDLAKELEKKNVKFKQNIESTFFRDILGWVIPALVFFGLWMFIIRKMTGKDMPGGLMTVGKSKAKIYVEKDTGVTFADVAGLDEARQELEEIVNFLKEPDKYSRLGGKMPKGVLLVGPPGTGKTLIAKAVAGEAKVPFFSISGSEFVEMFVGVGAARVRDLFSDARKSSPCIIFIDELDALGKARSAGPMSGGYDEKEHTLNQLLAELDGFDSREGVILLAATNRPEILDPALLRAGRFDRQVLIDRPDSQGRAQILRVHIKKVKVDPQLPIADLANLTTGLTGADLANLVNEATLVATREGAEMVNLDHFTKALERLVAGLERKNRILNAFERSVTAHHEMGHAIMGMLLKTTETLHKVSIIPRGIGALGYTIQRPTEDRFLMRSEELSNKICVLLGGRASEKLIFNHYSTGAMDDLAKATDIARNMVTRYGMCEKLGPVSYESHATFIGGRNVSEEGFSQDTSREIDLAIKEIIEACFQKSINLLRQNRAVLEKGAQELLAKETLTGDELQALIKDNPLVDA